MVEPRTKFWMVWCPQGGPPTVRHGSRESAEAEATRLAGKNPGREFFILKAVGGRFAGLPQVSEIKLSARPSTQPVDDMEIPF